MTLDELTDEAILAEAGLDSVAPMAPAKPRALTLDDLSDESIIADYEAATSQVMAPAHEPRGMGPGIDYPEPPRGESRPGVLGAAQDVAGGFFRGLVEGGEAGILRLYRTLTMSPQERLAELDGERSQGAIPANITDAIERAEAAKERGAWAASREAQTPGTWRARWTSAAESVGQSLTAAAPGLALGMMLPSPAGKVKAASGIVNLWRRILSGLPAAASGGTILGAASYDQRITDLLRTDWGRQHPNLAMVDALGHGISEAGTEFFSNLITFGAGKRILSDAGVKQFKRIAALKGEAQKKALAEFGGTWAGMIKASLGKDLAAAVAAEEATELANEAIQRGVSAATGAPREAVPFKEVAATTALAGGAFGGVKVARTRSAVAAAKTVLADPKADPEARYQALGAVASSLHTSGAKEEAAVLAADWSRRIDKSEPIDLAQAGVDETDPAGRVTSPASLAGRTATFRDEYEANREAAPRADEAEAGAGAVAPRGAGERLGWVRQQLVGIEGLNPEQAAIVPSEKLSTWQQKLSRKQAEVGVEVVWFDPGTPWEGAFSGGPDTIFLSTSLPAADAVANAAHEVGHGLDQVGALRGLTEDTRQKLARAITPEDWAGRAQNYDIRRLEAGKGLSDRATRFDEIAQDIRSYLYPLLGKNAEITRANVAGFVEQVADRPGRWERFTDDVRTVLARAGLAQAVPARQGGTIEEWTAAALAAARELNVWKQGRQGQEREKLTRLFRRVPGVETVINASDRSAPEVVAAGKPQVKTQVVPSNAANRKAVEKRTLFNRGQAAPGAPPTFAKWEMVRHRTTGEEFQIVGQNQDGTFMVRRGKNGLQIAVPGTMLERGAAPREGGPPEVAKKKPLSPARQRAETNPRREELIRRAAELGLNTEPMKDLADAHIVLAIKDAEMMADDSPAPPATKDELRLEEERRAIGLGVDPDAVPNMGAAELLNAIQAKLDARQAAGGKRPLVKPRSTPPVVVKTPPPADTPAPSRRPAPIEAGDTVSYVHPRTGERLNGKVVRAFEDADGAPSVTVDAPGEAGPVPFRADDVGLVQKRAADAKAFVPTAREAPKKDAKKKLFPSRKKQPETAPVPSSSSSEPNWDLPQSQWTDEMREQYDRWQREDLEPAAREASGFVSIQNDIRRRGGFNLNDPKQKAEFRAIFKDRKVMPGIVSNKSRMSADQMAHAMGFDGPESMAHAIRDEMDTKRPQFNPEWERNPPEGGVNVPFSLPGKRPLFPSRKGQVEAKASLPSKPIALRYARGSDQVWAIAKQFLRKPIYNEDKGVTATVSRNSLEEMLNPGAVYESISPQAHMQAVANIDKLFPIAVFRGDRPDKKGNQEIERMRHFVVPMPFDGDIVLVKIMAKEYKRPEQGTRLYLLNAVEIETELVPVGAEPTSLNESASPVSSPAHELQSQFSTLLDAVKRGEVFEGYPAPTPRQEPEGGKAKAALPAPKRTVIGDRTIYGEIGRRAASYRQNKGTGEWEVEYFKFNHLYGRWKDMTETFKTKREADVFARLHASPDEPDIFKYGKSGAKLALPAPGSRVTPGARPAGTARLERFFAGRGMNLYRAADWAVKYAPAGGKPAEDTISQTPEGREYLQKVERAWWETRRKIAAWGKGLREARRGLSKADRRYIRTSFMRDYEEEGADRAWPSPAVAAFARAWQDANETIAAEAGETIPEFKGRESGTYVPHRLTDKGREILLKQNGPEWDALLEQAKTNGIDTKVFLGLREATLKQSKYGSIDFARVADLPWQVTTADGRTVDILERDPEVIFSHIRNAARRLSTIQEFGRDEATQEYHDQVAQGLVYSGALDAEATKEALARIWKRLEGQDAAAGREAFGKFAPAWQAVDSVVAALNLSGAVIGNLIGGHLPETVRMGLGPTARAFKDAFTTRLKNPDLAELHALVDLEGDLLHELAATETLEGKVAKGAGKVLVGTGFVGVNRRINLAVARAMQTANLRLMLERVRTGKTSGRLWGQDAGAARRYLTEELRFSEEDVDRMAHEGPTAQDMARAIGKELELVNAMSESPGSRPRYIAHPLWRMGFAYSTFVRKMYDTTKFAAREAKAGNVRPLATLLVAGTVTAEVMKAVKDALKDREDEDKGFIDRLAGDMTEVGALGLAGSMSYAIKRIDDPQADFFSDAFKPPHFETIKALGSGLYKSGKEISLRPLWKETARVASAVDIVDKQATKRGLFGKGYRDRDAADRLVNQVYLENRKLKDGTQRAALDAIPSKFRPNTSRALVERLRERYSDEQIVEMIREARARRTGEER